MQTPWINVSATVDMIADITLRLKEIYKSGVDADHAGC